MSKLLWRSGNPGLDHPNDEDLSVVGGPAGETRTTLISVFRRGPRSARLRTGNWIVAACGAWVCMIREPHT
jgi:hypothetical protein